MFTAGCATFLFFVWSGPSFPKLAKGPPKRVVSPPISLSNPLFATLRHLFFVRLLYFFSPRPFWFFSPAEIFGVLFFFSAFPGVLSEQPEFSFFFLSIRSGLPSFTCRNTRSAEFQASPQVPFFFHNNQASLSVPGAQGISFTTPFPVRFTPSTQKLHLTVSSRLSVVTWARTRPCAIRTPLPFLLF